MNKNQFHKYYQRVAGSNDKGGELSEYVFVYVMFRNYFQCCFSNVFLAFDNNQDGSIDFSEFSLAYCAGIKQDLDSQLDLAFEM